MSAIEKWLAQPESLEQIRHHAPPSFDAEKTKRSVLSLLHADKVQGGRLSQCSPRSLVICVVQAAALGLELGTGDAYVIPYKNEATLSVGYRGMIKLAKRSGEVTHIKAEVVYESEHFRVWSDHLGEHVEHQMNFPRSEEPIKAVYARIVCHDGYVDHEVMDAAQIDRIRKASEAKMNGKTSPAWRLWADEMGKKAVIRRALKRYTLDSQAEEVFMHEDRVIYGNVEVVTAPPKTAALNQRLQLVADDPAPPQAPEEPPVEPSPPSEAGGSEGDMARHRGAIFAMLNKSNLEQKVVEAARRQFVWATYEATSLADLGVEEFEDFRKTLASLDPKDGPDELSELDDWLVGHAMEFDEDQWKAAKETA